MKREALISQIFTKKSYLCIGLDSDIDRLPKHLLDHDDPVFEFNKQIIDATKDLCVAYKPNIAFYESLGPKGWESLAKTLDYIPNTHFTIADAKRGDIGNTSRLYAKTFFEHYNFDSVTVAPYMGADSVKPFLEFNDKWVILLALTSNKSAQDFQFHKENEKALYQAVLQKSQEWSTDQNMMYVVGATKPEFFEEIRKWVPNHFLLVPGVGAQGGSVESVAKYGLNEDVGLLINSSRSIIFAGNGQHFAEKARDKASMLQKDMSKTL